jgi:hypothetical protein
MRLLKISAMTAGLACAAANAAGLVFSSFMEGSQETPPVATAAKAVMGFQLNATQDTMTLHMAATGLSGPITGAHIHRGLPGVAGPVVVDLMPSISQGHISASWTGFETGNLAHFLRGDYYVNLHTAAHPNGEIRGQLLLEMDTTFSAELTGAQETPPVESPGRGLGTFALSADDSTLIVNVAFTGLDSVTTAHIHKGPPGVAGPIVIDLTDSIKNGFISMRASLNGRSEAPQALLDSLRKGSLYVNVHTKAHPNGEIRGQLLLDAPGTLAAVIGGAGENPAVTGGGKAVAIFRLNADLDTLGIESLGANMSGDITAAQINLASGGLGGTVGANLATSITGRRLHGQVAGTGLTPALIKGLLAGNASLNLMTAAHPLGEAAGKLALPARIGFAFGMDGAHETPPVNTTAVGAVVATMSSDSSNLRFMVAADTLGSSFTDAHFHKAPPGVAGPVVFPIKKFFTGLAARGAWTTRDSLPFTKAMASAFLSDSLYVNIHSQQHPTGEIRGQAAEDRPGVIVLGVRPMARGNGAGGRMEWKGAQLRVRGLPGSIMEVTFSDLRGRQVAAARLLIGADGFSRPWDAAALRPGLYVAALQGGKTVFLKP